MSNGSGSNLVCQRMSGASSGWTIAASSDCPPEYGPPTTIYNRFVRWARRGVWENLFRDLAENGRSTDTQMIDSTHVKAHRSAAGGKGGSRSRLLAARAEGA